MLSAKSSLKQIKLKQAFNDNCTNIYRVSQRNSFMLLWRTICKKFNQKLQNGVAKAVEKKEPEDEVKSGRWQPGEQLLLRGVLAVLARSG